MLLFTSAIRGARVAPSVRTGSWSAAGGFRCRYSGPRTADGVSPFPSFHIFTPSLHSPSSLLSSSLPPLPQTHTHTHTHPPGVRSTVDIKKGQFVDRYIGEVITARESSARRKISSHKKDVYLFDLDKFHDPSSLDPRLREPPHVVDGEFMSGPTRFINHSCDPNLRIYSRVGDHVDKNLHDLALFAVRDMPRGAELTFDYTAGVVEDEVGGDRAGMTRCFCGSENCRGWLF